MFNSIYMAFFSSNVDNKQKLFDSIHFEHIFYYIFCNMSSSDKLHLISKIDQHSQSSLLTPNSQLDKALSNSAANGLPPITVSALQGQYLAIQCQLIGAKTVLEVGTLGGYSTIWFASTGAKVTSIEINPKHRDIALENTKDLDVDIILGAALDVLPKLVEEGRKFDFVFIDASWDEQFKYFQWAKKLTRPNGCIYVDNVVRALIEGTGDVAEGETVLTQVGKEKGVTATLVTTVSSHKGRADEMMDGFLLAVVKE
jgi:predicted O-methyltransferase YrrM